MMGISSLTSLPSRIIVIIAVLAVTHTWIYKKGRDHQKIDQLKANIEAYKARNETDETISNLDDIGLCVELSLLPEQQCRELLGLEEAPNAE